MMGRNGWERLLTWQGNGEGQGNGEARRTDVRGDVYSVRKRDEREDV